MSAVNSKMLITVVIEFLIPALIFPLVFFCSRHPLLVLRLDLPDFVLQLLFLALFCGCSDTVAD